MCDLPGVYPDEELIEYMVLCPEDTGLKVFLFADSGGACIRNEHKPCIYMPNGYDIHDVPVRIDLNSVSTDMFAVKDLKISRQDFDGVIRYINLNMEELVAMAEERLNNYVYIKTQKPISNANT